MAYTDTNFKTKKALKEAIAAGKEIRLQPEFLGHDVVNGTAYLEGPHYPAMHTWYAQATIVDGVVVKVK